MEKNNLPTRLGRFLAYFQDTADRLFGFGFDRLRRFGENMERKNTSALGKSLRNVSRFLGDLGTAYYRKYSSLKEERARKEK